MPAWVKLMIFWVTVILVMIFTSTSFDQLIALPYSRYLYPVLPIFLILIILTVKESGIIKVLESDLLRYIGSISYGIYIFHMPCIKLVAKCQNALGVVPSENRFLLLILSFTLTMIIAGTCTKYLETPVLNLIKNKVRRRGIR